MLPPPGAPAAGAEAPPPAGAKLKEGALAPAAAVEKVKMPPLLAAGAEAPAAAPKPPNPLPEAARGWGLRGKAGLYSTPAGLPEHGQAKTFERNQHSQ